MRPLLDLNTIMESVCTKVNLTEYWGKIGYLTDPEHQTVTILLCITGEMEHTELVKMTYRFIENVTQQTLIDVVRGSLNRGIRNVGNR